jgi:hypothetical protein
VGQVPIKLVKMGTWVGKEGSIDIIGQNAQRENVVGICSWTEDEFSYGRYEKLLVQMKKAKTELYIFHRLPVCRKLCHKIFSRP